MALLAAHSRHLLNHNGNLEGFEGTWSTTQNESLNIRRLCKDSFGKKKDIGGRKENLCKHSHSNTERVIHWTLFWTTCLNQMWTNRKKLCKYTWNCSLFNCENKGDILSRAAETSVIYWLKTTNNYFPQQIRNVPLVSHVLLLFLQLFVCFFNIKWVN